MRCRPRSYYPIIPCKQKPGIESPLACQNRGVSSARFPVAAPSVSTRRQSILSDVGLLQKSHHHLRQVFRCSVRPASLVSFHYPLNVGYDGRVLSDYFVVWPISSCPAHLVMPPALPVVWPHLIVRRTTRATLGGLAHHRDMRGPLCVHPCPGVLLHRASLFVVKPLLATLARPTSYLWVMQIKHHPAR